MRYLFIFITFIIFFFSCSNYEVIDTTKPSAYINFPYPGDLVSDTLIISAIGSDNVGIDFMELWINQEKTDLKDFDYPFEFILDTRSLLDIEEGDSINLAVKAYDTSENESSLSDPPVKVYLDNSNPTKIVLYPIIDDDGSLEFRWEKSTDLDFFAYVIMQKTNNNFISALDTIKPFRDADLTDTIMQYPSYSEKQFGIQVLDKGLNSTLSNFVKPIAFEFTEISDGFFKFGENDNPATVSDPFELMVSEVSNSQYISYLNVAKELNQIDINNIGPWVLDNDGKILYDLENGFIKWDGTTFDIFVLDDPPIFVYDYPVTYVSYYGAQHFADFFNFYLPNEFQWEKAAIGEHLGIGNQLGNYDYPWGGEVIDCDEDGVPEPCEYPFEPNNANYYQNENYQYTNYYGLVEYEEEEPYEPPNENLNISYDDPGLAPVSNTGISSINPYFNEFWFFEKCPNQCNGLNHMAGNVWEWVVHEGGYSDSQMSRGGSWRSPKQDLKVWSKKYLNAHYTGDNVGFRCARDE